MFGLRVTKFENGHSTAVIWRPVIPENDEKKEREISAKPSKPDNGRGNGRGGTASSGRGKDGSLNEMGHSKIEKARWSPMNGVRGRGRGSFNDASRGKDKGKTKE